jgi:hypothetical protein
MALMLLHRLRIPQANLYQGWQERPPTHELQDLLWPIDAAQNRASKYLHIY